MEYEKIKEIQKRMALILRYLRILNRLTANEITERTGVNFYLLENGKRPVSISGLIKLEPFFGMEAISNILKRSWDGNGEWTEEAIKERTLAEQILWNKEKIMRKENRNERPAAPLGFWNIIRKNTVGFVNQMRA
jgi:transcriptional regulator with XRE-family HTH domain